jgi:hypothetical protein
MGDNLVGIVCSTNAKRAYCVKGTYYHKRIRMDKLHKNDVIIYIPHIYFHPLTFRNIEYVLAHEVKRTKVKQKGF